MSTRVEKFLEKNARWIEAFSAMDINRIEQYIDEMYTDDYKMHMFSAVFGVSNEQPGREGQKKGMRENISQMQDQLSSFLATYEDQFGVGDKVTTRITYRWTNKADGKKMIMEGISIVRADEEGRTAEEWQVQGPAREE